MRRLTQALTIMLLLTGAAAAQNPTEFRDAQGRLTGTAVRNGDHTTTFRDRQGRLTGTATDNRDGSTTYRDAQGRLTGTSRR